MPASLFHCRGLMSESTQLGFARPAKIWAQPSTAWIARRKKRCDCCAISFRKSRRFIITSNCSATSLCRRRNRPLKRTALPMNRGKRRFSTGLRLSEFCATSQRRLACPSVFTRWPSGNWKQSSGLSFIRCPPIHLNRKPNENESAEIFQQNHSSHRAAHAARHGFMLERADGEGQQHRLLDVHNASIGARKGTRQMSHLFDGSCASHEGERNPRKFQ